MHKSRYIVTNENGEWQIRNAHRHVTATFPSKAQALCAAIELAEKDGESAIMPRRFLFAMRTIASSQSGCTESCIRINGASGW